MGVAIGARAFSIRSQSSVARGRVAARAARASSGRWTGPRLAPPRRGSRRRRGIAEADARERSGVAGSRRGSRWARRWPAATLFVAVKVVTPSDGGRVAFYEHAWTAGGRPDRRPSTRRSPTSRAGDQVGAIDGRSMEAWAGALSRPVGGPTRPAAPIAYVVERAGEAATIDVTWAPPGVGALGRRGWSVSRALGRPRRASPRFVLARRPGRARGRRRSCSSPPGSAGSSVPWFLGTTTERRRAGRPVPVPRPADRRPVHGHVAGRGAPRARVPEPACRGRRRPWIAWLPYAVAFGAYAVALAAGRLGSPSTARLDRRRGRASSSPSSSRASRSGSRWPSTRSSARPTSSRGAAAAGRCSARASSAVVGPGAVPDPGARARVSRWSRRAGSG